MDGVMTLADFLLTNRSVYSLDLRANISPPTEMNYRIGESGDEAIKYLGALLKLNSTVTHLDLCSNSIGNPPLSFFGDLSANFGSMNCVHVCMCACASSIA
jgi:hypothetical protein